jgi:outer membrane protein OmpA-like peptidoglycan-associated protein
MEAPLNLRAIYLTLAATVGVGVLYISVEAPKIQQDILGRCQDALTTHRISSDGLSVDGRDVLLSGPTDSAIVSARAYAAVEEVSGVRVVTTRILPGSALSGPALAGTGGSTVEKEIQAKIDGVLQNQSIGFKADSTLLTAESELALDRIASYLAEAPTLLCEIRGYDSKPPEDRQTWVLTLQRALATEDYLESKGIANWRLAAKPVQVSESIMAARRTDRLIDLVVLSRE